MNQSLHGLSRLVPGYALAVVFGAIGHLANVPLAWLLGSLLAAAVLSLSGVELRPPNVLRRFGQVVVGVAIGLNLTPPVIAGLVSQLPLMIVSAFFAVVVSAVFSVGLAKFGDIDDKSAFLAMMPGGQSEMGTIGVTLGAKMEPIIIAHTLRVAAILFLVPPLVLLASDHKPLSPDPGTIVGWLPVLLLIVGGALTGYVVHLLRLNNPAMIGAIIFVGALAATGHVTGHISRPLFSFAQIFLGFALGVRFRRDMIRRLPRLSAISAIFVVLFLITMLAYSLTLMPFGGLDFLTAALAVSPGGMSEMTATAEALRVGTATVAGYHVVRAFLVTAFAVYYWHSLVRIGFFRTMSRVWDKVLPFGGDSNKS